jgi:hypothetical protein
MTFSRSISAVVLVMRRSLQQIRLGIHRNHDVLRLGFANLVSLFRQGDRIDVVTTGMVIRKMISNTSITSTSVVLIAETISSFLPFELPTVIDMARPAPAPASWDAEERRAGRRRAADHVHGRLVATNGQLWCRAPREQQPPGRMPSAISACPRVLDFIDRRLSRNADRGQRVINPQTVPNNPTNGAVEPTVAKSKTVLGPALQ